MKRRISALLIAILALFCLTGCSGGISADEAKAHTDTFFAAVSAGDYAAAEACLHPERPTDLTEYFTSLLAGIGQPADARFAVSDYNGFRSAVYDSTVDGATYIHADDGGHLRHDGSGRQDRDRPQRRRLWDLQSVADALIQVSPLPLTLMRGIFLYKATCQHVSPADAPYLTSS